MKKTKRIQSGLAAALLLGTLMPMVAQAQVTQQILVGQTAPSTAIVSPAVKVDAGDHLFMRVFNPTAGPVTFSVPELGINYGVPAMSEKTFFINTANLMDHQIPYAVLGPGGTQLASGTIINEDYFTAGEQYAVALNRIVNYSTAYSAPIDPEPAYRERPVALPQRQMIRGFW